MSTASLLLLSHTTAAASHPIFHCTQECASLQAVADRRCSIPNHLRKIVQLLLTLICCCSLQLTVVAQKHERVSVRDSLDGKFDLSDYMITLHGALVVPTIITEPALGNFGGAVIPIFLKPVPPIIDTINGERRITPQAPDITGGIGMYTLNDSWMVGAFRSATLPKARIKYRVFAAYTDINMAFYKTYENFGEREFDFNLEMVPVYLSVLRQFKDPKWSAGIQYTFLHVDVSPRGELPDFVTEQEISSLVSQVGGQLQFDSRDNILTPNQGIRVQTDFFWSNKAIGSDYDAWRINYSAIGYLPLFMKLIGGLRIEGAQALGDPPFFLKPFVNLRGVPVMRYQGNATLLTEAEFRWDLYRRWSLVFYGGTAAAYDDWDEMFKEPLVYNYGTGFRYLIARKFKLRMGIDIARGPENWSYYIVFGSSWFR